MDNELVSIIIRTSGRPEVLRNALESVRRQTYPDWIEGTYIEKAVSVLEGDPGIGIVYCRADLFRSGRP